MRGRGQGRDVRGQGAGCEGSGGGMSGVRGQAREALTPNQPASPDWCGQKQH